MQSFGSTYTTTVDASTYVSVTVTNSDGESDMSGLFTYVSTPDPCYKPHLPGCDLPDPDLPDLDLMSLEVADESTSGASSSSLSISPNPAATSAQVRLSLAHFSEVRVDVYDLLGRRVRSVAEGEFEQGHHVFAFERGDLPAGAYVVRATTDRSAVSTVLTIR